jgi:excisionase family DNA binding protein
MLLSIEGVARTLGISERTARHWVASIPAVMVGKRRRWRSEVIDSALRDATVPPLNGPQVSGTADKA